MHLAERDSHPTIAGPDHITNLRQEDQNHKKKEGDPNDNTERNDEVGWLVHRFHPGKVRVWHMSALLCGIVRLWVRHANLSERQNHLGALVVATHDEWRFAIPFLD